MAIKLGGGGLLRAFAACCSSCWHSAPQLQSQRSTSAAEASCRSAWPASASTARRPRSSSSRSGVARCCRCRRHRHRRPARHRHRRRPARHRITTSFSSTSVTTSFATHPNPNQVLPVPIPRQSVLACEQALSSRTPAMAEVLIHCRALASRDDGIVDQLPWQWNPSELAKRDGVARLSGRDYPQVSE